MLTRPNILSPPRLISGALSAGDLNTSEADLYALKLAALALVGDGAAKPALAVLQTLKADILDGTIDGQEGEVSIEGAAYSDLSTALSSALNTFSSNYGTADLQTLVSAYEPINTDLNGGSSSECSDVIYTDANGFFLFMEGTYVATSVTGGGGEFQTTLAGYNSIELRFVNNGLGGSLQFFSCTAESLCSYQATYSAFASSLKSEGGFEKLATETNLYFNAQLDTDRSIFYDHNTCKITLEIRQASVPTNWVQAIYEPAP